MQIHDALPEGEGSKLSPEVVAFRLEVLETVLRAGDSVEKVDVYRPLFERGGFALTTSGHMRQLIPTLAHRYAEADKESIHGPFPLVSIIFDGTSHFGELLLVFVRLWTGRNYEQLLLRLRHSDIPLDKNILAFQLLKVMERYRIEGKNIVAFVKDSAAVNYAAVEFLKSNPDHGLRGALNLPCWSHIFDRIGKRLNRVKDKSPLALPFIATWSSYFKKSYKVDFPPSRSSSPTP
jgi:hypothetical protein